MQATQSTFEEYEGLSARLIERFVREFIERAAWQTAKSVEHVAGGSHQYIVRDSGKDDITPDEFADFRNVIQRFGRHEQWQAPPAFYSDGRRPRYKNHYLYVAEFAYWHTWPRACPSMLNREHVSVQLATPTRRVIEPPLAPPQLQIADPNDATLHRSLADQEGSR